jgi:hypothetical protein
MPRHAKSIGQTFGCSTCPETFLLQAKIAGMGRTHDEFAACKRGRPRDSRAF